MYPNRYQQELVTFMSRFQFNAFVTLTFNDVHSFDFMCRKLKTFHARIDCGLLGRKWAKKSVDERTFFVAYAEKLNSNAHFHLLMKAPDNHMHKIIEIAPTIWRYLVPAGDCRIDTYSEADQSRVASYVTKEQRYSANNSNFIISTEFSSR